MFFSHRSVGALLLCQLLGEPIARSREQTIAGGGCFFAFETRALRVVQGWEKIVSVDVLPAEGPALAVSTPPRS